MANWHGYWAIEDLNLNNSQRQTLIEALLTLGANNNHPDPSRRNHRRVSLDNKKVIFEALWNIDNITEEKFKTRLAALFGVDPSTIDVELQGATFLSRTTPIATFSRGGTNYLRVPFFGGLAATWQQSNDEVRAYIAANISAWEEEIPA
jgi:hypothetical protein